MSALSLKPQNITPELWYYEKRGGILLVHEIRVVDQPRGTGTTATETRYVRTDQILVPWRKIRTSLRRKDAPDKDEP